jgi:hypothetical protein
MTDKQNLDDVILITLLLAKSDYNNWRLLNKYIRFVKHNDHRLIEEHK